MKIIIRFLNLKITNKIFRALVNSRISKIFIPLFRWHYKIDTHEILQPQKFKSLNDYFTRDIDLKYRPLGDADYISPCDGLITAAGRLSQNTRFQVKGVLVDAKELLGKDIELKSYQVIYLSPRDYHQFHAIDDNQALDIYSIGSTSIPVNELGFKMGNPFLENYRIVMETKDYFYVAVGATNVNSIELNVKKFRRGDRIGEFKFGSTIVLLYKNEVENLVRGKIKARENLYQSG